MLRQFFFCQPNPLRDVLRSLEHREFGAMQFLGDLHRTLFLPPQPQFLLYC